MAAPDTTGPTTPVEVQADYSDAWRAYLTEQRATSLDRLTAFAHARVFPINNLYRGALSQLRDTHGNPCAMAYLVEQSGRADLIDTLSVTANQTQFATLTDGPLYDWTLTSGLLLEEAAMVQVPDFFIGDEVGDITPELQQLENDRLQAHFATTAAMLRAAPAQTLDLTVERLGDRIHTPPPTDLLARR